MPRASGKQVGQSFQRNNSSNEASDETLCLVS